MNNPLINDEQLSTLQLIDSDTLAKAARGEVDLNHVAKIILAQRGHDLNGKWVGFNQAAKIHNIAV
jgi:hypothetical protein